MSLINEMLKELEKKPRNLPPANLLTGLKADFTFQLHRNRSYFVVIGVLSLILAVCGFLLLLKQAHPPALTLKTVSTPVKTVMVKSEQTAPSSIPAFTQLSTIALQVQQNNASLRFLLNQAPLYQVSSVTANHELTVTFQNTRLMAALPKLDYTGSGVEDIKALEDDHNNLRIILKLSANADIKRLELNEDGAAPELQMDIASTAAPVTAAVEQPVVEPAVQPTAIIKPIAESRPDEQYQHALRLTSENREPDAIVLLKALLIEFPEHTQAREYLADLYIEKNDYSDAEKVLHEGLKIVPENAGFIKLSARILVDEGQLHEALTLLEKKPPGLTEDTEYHALMAALYQRTNQNTLAANIYKQLLILEPNNAKWWVGLGVALQTRGDHVQAQEAFANADNIGGLSPELKAYLETQLNTL